MYKEATVSLNLLFQDNVYDVFSTKEDFYAFTGISKGYMQKIFKGNCRSVTYDYLTRVVLALRLPYEDSMEIMLKFNYCPNPYSHRDRILVRFLKEEKRRTKRALYDLDDLLELFGHEMLFNSKASMDSNLSTLELITTS